MHMNDVRDMSVFAGAASCSIPNLSGEKYIFIKQRS